MSSTITRNVRAPSVNAIVVVAGDLFGTVFVNPTCAYRADVKTERYDSRTSTPVNSNVKLDAFHFFVMDVPETSASIVSAAPSGKSANVPSPSRSYRTKSRLSVSSSGSETSAAEETSLTPNRRSRSPKDTTRSKPGTWNPFTSITGGSFTGKISMSALAGELETPSTSVTTNSTPRVAGSGFLPECEYVTFFNASRSACVVGASFESSVLSPLTSGASNTKTLFCLSTVTYTRPRQEIGSDADAATATTSTPGPTRARSYETCASAFSWFVTSAYVSSHARYAFVTSNPSNGASTGLVRRTTARTSGAPPDVAPASNVGDVSLMGASFSRKACLRVVPFAVCSGWTSRGGSFAADARTGAPPRARKAERRIACPKLLGSAGRGDAGPKPSSLPAWSRPPRHAPSASTRASATRARRGAAEARRRAIPGARGGALPPLRSGRTEASRCCLGFKIGPGGAHRARRFYVF